jgi:hypothetical protein
MSRIAFSIAIRLATYGRNRQKTAISHRVRMTIRWQPMALPDSGISAKIPGPTPAATAGPYS